MKEVHVFLPTVDKVQAFVKALVPLEGDFELLADHVVLDARSLMGIFSFDLSKPIRLKIYEDTQENLQAVQPFTVCEENMK